MRASLLCALCALCAAVPATLKDTVLAITDHALDHADGPTHGGANMTDAEMSPDATRAGATASASLIDAAASPNAGLAGANPTDAKACATAPWVIVLSTGRAGSTTIFNMLTQAGVAMSPENKLLGSLESLVKKTTALHAEHDHSFAHPRLDTHAVNDAACRWLAALQGPVPEAAPRGFKEIRDEGVELLPRIFSPSTTRYVLNYRKNVTAQRQSGYFEGKSSRQSDYLAKSLAHFRAALSGESVFELPLEDFSVSNFNRLFDWLDLPCRTRFVLQAHADSSYNDDTRSDAVKCDTASGAG